MGMPQEHATVEPRAGGVQASPKNPVPDRKLLRLLAIGFALIIALLGIDGFIGFRAILSIRKNVSTLTGVQFRNVALIDEVQRAQSSLSSVLYGLPATSGQENRKEFEISVSRIKQNLKHLFAQIPAGDPDVQVWREVEQVSSAVTEEADRILHLAPGVKPDFGDLIKHRDRLRDATAKLIAANHDRAEATKREIDRIASTQLIEDGTLLTGCLLVACLCAGLVLRTATGLYRRITEQAKELSLVSWQLLEKQESLARRLSHELHDELGQCLTALKTNFTRHAASSCVDKAWMQDCIQLLKESIRSAHEISQLLRPTILDDFGLDSALSWLCERFEERNDTEVKYTSRFSGRLDEQKETQLFRIAQEALTNIARHAEASRVEVSLTHDGSVVRLKISDNGVGLTHGRESSGTRFGLTGMRARARALQGEMDIQSAPGQGTVIEVSFSQRDMVHEETNPHLISR
jgi:signal transduction histidine kinase